MSPSTEEPRFATKDRLLCRECVEDTFLQAEIEKNGRDGKCFYCQLDGRASSIEQIANLVDTAISQHFCRVSLSTTDDADDPEKMSDDATDDLAGPNTLGQPVIELIKCSAGTDEAVAKDILRVLAERHHGVEHDLTGLGEGPFDDGAFYARSVPDGEGYWYAFEKGIKTETRFFNRAAEEILASMFQAIDGHRTVNGRPVIVEAGPGTELSVIYRARAFQGELKVREAMKRPDRDVGPPPSEKAIAGRMNAAGIAVFYGATDPDVALAEVQPPVGSKVLIGHFELLRPLMLLDTEALERVDAGAGSVFDPDYVNRLERTAFLRGLSQRIAKPVMPDDRVRDYLPTQAITDFLATAVDPPLDGILYPSVQVGLPSSSVRVFGARKDRRNVVLFQKAARVQALDLPDNAIIMVDDDNLFGTTAFFEGVVGVSDAPDLAYTVSELVADPAPSPEQTDASLRLTDLEVRYVRGIKFDTQASHVSRIRLLKPGP